MALERSGDEDQAIAEYREAVRLKPDWLDALQNLGVALKRRGDWDGAIASHREAVRLSPDLAAAHFNLGNALKDNGAIEQAIAEYREAMRLDPNLAEQPAVCFVLGTALEGKGHKRGALEQFRLACPKEPDNAIFCEKYRKVSAEFAPAKIEGVAQIKMKSGESLRGALQGIIVQTCVNGPPPAGKRITSLRTKGGLTGTLEEDSTVVLLRSNGIVIRLCAGQDVSSIDEKGLSMRTDQSLFLLLSNLKGPLTTSVALDELRAIWADRTYSVESRSFVSSALEEGGMVMAFAAPAAQLDQSRCSVEGTIKQEKDGSVKIPVKILPTIQLRNERSLQAVPVKQIVAQRTDGR